MFFFVLLEAAALLVRSLLIAAGVEFSLFFSLSLSLSLFTHILVVVVVVVVADVVSFLFLSLSLSLSFLFCSWSVFSGPPFLFYFFSDEGIFTTHPVAGIGHKKKQQHQQRAPLFFLT